METQASITLPEMLLASARTHNRLVRESVVDVLRWHKENVLPRHFAPGNAERYGFMPRTKGYREMKAKFFNSVTDLVKTRKTRDYLKAVSPPITISGSASADTIRGRYRIRLPFGGGTGRRMDESAWQRLEQALAKTTNPRQQAVLRAALDRRRSARGRTGVTPAQIVHELQTITRDEADEITRRIGERYLQKIASLKRPRRVTGKTLPTV